MLCQKERVYWTGLHRLLDSTAGMLCQKERGLKKQRESKRSWASEEGGKGRRALVEGGKQVLEELP